MNPGPSHRAAASSSAHEAVPRPSAVGFWRIFEHRTAASDCARWPVEWFRQWKSALPRKPDEVDKMSRALCHLRGLRDAPRSEASGVLEQIRKNRRGIRKNELSDRRLSVGSGIAAAAKKALVNSRKKRTGMRWSAAGGKSPQALERDLKLVW